MNIGLAVNLNKKTHLFPSPSYVCSLAVSSHAGESLRLQVLDVEKWAETERERERFVNGGSGRDLEKKMLKQK